MVCNQTCHGIFSSSVFGLRRIRDRWRRAVEDGKRGWAGMSGMSGMRGMRRGWLGLAASPDFTQHVWFSVT